MWPAITLWLRLLAPADYDANAAQLDIETLTTARGTDYTLARGRLDAHPEIAAAAALSRLDASPPLGPAEHQRILVLLAGFRRPELLPRFGDQLRLALKEGRDISTWRRLVVDQGAPAADVLIGLVGDPSQDLEVRASFLADLVHLIDSSRLPETVAMIGRGHPDLQRSLRRALTRRARSRTEDRVELAAAMDIALQEALGTDGSRAAALIATRDALDHEQDGFSQRLISIAEDESSAFPARIAAVRGLAGDPGANPTLETLARKHFAGAIAGAQASELIVWTALRALPDPQASAISADVPLRDSDAPRLAALGWRLSSLPSDGSWLKRALEHAWPEVRTAAIARVSSPCAAPIIETLSEASERERDDAPAVAMIEALGRCGGESSFDAIASTLQEPEVPLAARRLAACTLVKKDLPRGAQLVTKLLEQTGDPKMIRVLTGCLKQE